ncbi:hypothetical protein B0H19DRAFT_1141766 [Mycena capillaripes]|nr:hypothetical protein B0H19DRAFT_1141766 [Mycena capillaripes]
MYIRPALFLSALVISPALGSIALYGQCGGDGIVWADTCALGLSCVFYNDWFSQCLPATEATAPPAPTGGTSAPQFPRRRLVLEQE